MFHCVIPDNSSRQNRSCTFINQSFVHALNMTTISGLLIRLYILRFPPSKRWIRNVIRPALASRQLSFSHRHDATSHCLFYKYFYDICSDVLFSLVHEFKRASRLATGSHRLAVELAGFNRQFYSNGFVIRAYFSPFLHPFLVPDNLKCNLSLMFSGILHFPLPSWLLLSFSFYPYSYCWVG